MSFDLSKLAEQAMQMQKEAQRLQEEAANETVTATAGGGMVSAVVKGGEKAALRFLERCEIFTLAESLGGVETLICHPATMTHAALGAKGRKAIGITDGMVRISVGIEDVGDIVRDLEKALHAI